MNIAETQTALAKADDPAVPAEVVAEAIGKVDALMRFARELRANCDRVVLEWVLLNGPLTVGDVKYYAGFRKVTKCQDNAAAVELLLTETGGDVQQLAACIASDGLKPGACREVLGPRFGEVFTTEERPELREGKPVKGLLKANTKFQGEAQ